MKSRLPVLIGTLTLLLASASGAAFATGKCGGADIANGPFTYSVLSPAQITFNGNGGLPITTNFFVTAPSVDPKQQTDAPDLFPGEGAAPCTDTAEAVIGVLEIQKVGDADGNPIDPITLDTSSTLFFDVAVAFSVTPNTNVFDIGGTTNVTVIISNPNLLEAHYGDYDIKLAAHAPGYGIGVGNGPRFTLSLRADSDIDVTPPVVTITKPADMEILGVIPVEVLAFDPSTPLPATGLFSMSATISSAEGTVSNHPIPLELDYGLPVAAGITVTGTGTYTPTGGSGMDGKSDATCFTDTFRSGIGSYIINAQATDGAGNVGYASKSFKVKYDVTFTKQDSTNSCETGGNQNCTGKFKFMVTRSAITSDGAFMYDHTVMVNLVRASDNVLVASHIYGTGDIKDVVQIDTTITPQYQTNFRRGDIIGTSGPVSYVAKVYFLDVDGNLICEGESSPVTF